MENDIVKPPTPENSQPPTSKPIQDIAGPRLAESPTDASESGNPDNSQSVEQPAQKGQVLSRPKSRLPKGVIAVAILVFITLSGAVVYFALSQEDSLPSASSSNTLQQAAPSSAAKIDELKKAGDETTALPEADGDISSDISDQALGL